MSVKMYARFWATISGPNLSKFISNHTDEDGDQSIDFLSSCGEDSDVEEMVTSDVSTLSDSEGKFTGWICVRTDDRDCMSKLKMWIDDASSDSYIIDIRELVVKDAK